MGEIIQMTRKPTAMQGRFITLTEEMVYDDAPYPPLSTEQLDALFQRENEHLLARYVHGEITLDGLCRLLHYRKKEGRTMKKKNVLLGILLIFALVLAWDCYLYMDDVPGNSISQVIIELSEKSRLVAAFVGFLFGFLTSHFFDDYKEPRNP